MPGRYNPAKQEPKVLVIEPAVATCQSHQRPAIIGSQHRVVFKEGDNYLIAVTPIRKLTPRTNRHLLVPSTAYCPATGSRSRPRPAQQQQHRRIQNIRKDLLGRKKLAVDLPVGRCKAKPYSHPVSYEQLQARAEAARNFERAKQQQQLCEVLQEKVLEQITREAEAQGVHDCCSSVTGPAAPLTEQHKPCYARYPGRGPALSTEEDETVQCVLR